MGLEFDDNEGWEDVIFPNLRDVLFSMNPVVGLTHSFASFVRTHIVFGDQKKHTYENSKG